MIHPVRRAAAVILVFIAATAAAQRPWSARMAQSIITRWPDGQIMRGSDKLRDWAYDKNVLLAGFADIWQNTADPQYYRYIQRAMDRMISADGAINDYRADEISLDEVALGRELLLLYGRTRNPKYYKAAAVIRHQLDVQTRTPSGGFWHKQRYPNQMWLDGLYMAEPFYAQYAAMFQQPEAFADIARQFTLSESHTRDARTGLLYHAWDESKEQAWANKTTGTSPHVWGRAMGWYAMALVDTLPWFPADHPGRAELINILQREAAAIARVQDAQTGLWYQVLDRPKAPGNYFESSASCMFAYALAKGVRLGYLDPKYQKNATRAWQGILQRFVKADPDGTPHLTDTVYGAGLGGTPYRDGSYEYYIHEKVGPDDAKGIGAFLLAAAEMDLAPTATLARGKTVLLDAWFNSQKREDASGHSNYFHYKWSDYADSGFSTFGHVFRSYGARTEMLYTAPRLPDLQRAQVYIIVSPDIPARNPQPHYMQAEDAEQIAAWVRGGGVLLILQNDSTNSEFEHFNQLSEKFGIHYNAVRLNEVEGTKWEQGRVAIPAGTGPFSHAHTAYMKEISSITSSAPARTLFSHNSQGAMAMARFGRGLVLALVDPWLYNEYTDGLKLPPEYDQYAAGQELARWLLQAASSARASAGERTVP